MNTALWTGFFLLTTSALPVGSELHYAGQVTRQAENGDRGAESFRLVVTCATADDAWFLLEERGGAMFSWPQRFGRLATTPQQISGIRILQRHEDQDYALPVRHPVFEFVEKLIPETEWQAGSAQYTCVRHRQVKDRECAIVEASLDRGRRQTLVVDRNDGLILSMEERLFIGRGEAYQLTMQLENIVPLSVETLAQEAKVAKALLDLQAALKIEDADVVEQLSEEQLATTQNALSQLASVGEGTWGRFVTTIQRDIAVQQRRLEGVAGLQKKFLNQPATPLPDLTQIDGKSILAADLAGKTTVLHFWNYGGEKLEEPYGQVGYLDFLSQRRHKLGVQILGVAVDARFADPTTQAAGRRAARKFQEFMNVSFPIVADGGSLLESFGNPQALGATLPLWVVIGHDGVITHYQVGYYDLNPDEGLRELDAAVVSALKREKAAATK
ncbi:redoxin family protein [bacterium]|nr:redoxin family protein [bacterium]